MKNLVLFIFSIGLISIHLASTIASPGYESGPDTASNANHPQQIPPSDQSSPPLQVNQNPQTKPPSLTCILFKKFGCDTQCFVLGNLRNLKTSGSCSDSVCSCTITSEMTLRDLWRKKFDSRDVLDKIEKDPKLTEDVLKALRDPSRTAWQSGQDLESILPPDLYEKLQVKSIVETAQPKPDSARLKVRADSELKSVLKKTTEFESLDYKKSLKEYLENNKSNREIEKVIGQIHQTKNKVLETILNQFLAQHEDIPKGKILLQNGRRGLTTDEILTNIIINVFIEKIDSIDVENHGQEEIIPPENHPTTSQVD